jgi:hypothetical protein
MPGPISLTTRSGIFSCSHLARDSGITAPGLPFISYYLLLAVNDNAGHDEYINVTHIFINSVNIKF